MGLINLALAGGDVAEHAGRVLDVGGSDSHSRLNDHDYPSLCNSDASPNTKVPT